MSKPTPGEDFKDEIVKGKPVTVIGTGKSKSFAKDKHYTVHETGAKHLIEIGVVKPK
jgi:hypothetical protein